MSINNRAKQALEKTKLSTASNGTSLIDTYNDRILFEERHKIKNNTINVATDKELYGRLDTKQNTVYPKKESMIQLFSRGKSTNILVLPFVNDAFIQMENEILQGIRTGKIKQSELFPFLIQETYINFEPRYDNYVVGILGEFEKHLNTYEYVNKITNFKTYMNYFLDYIKPVNVPISATSFLLSLDINTSGLCFQIKNKDFSSDIEKEQFYNLPQFRLYDNTLRKYGFSYDVNAPWRVVFSVNSSFSKSYMSKYNITKEEDIFNLFYNKTYQTELDIIFKRFIDHYNSISNRYQFIFETKIINNTPYTTKIPRTYTNYEKEIENITENKLLKLYFYLRLKEENFELNQQEFEEVMSKMSLIYISSGKEAAYNFIVENTKTLPAGGRNPPLSLTRGLRSNKNTLNVIFKL